MIKIIKRTVLFLLAFMLTPSIAFAQEVATEESIMAVILSYAGEIVMTIVGLLAAWALTKGIKWFEEKTKIDIPQSLEDRVKQIVADGVAYAEQKSKLYLKDVGHKMPMNEKLENALEYIYKMLDAFGLPEMGKDYLVDLIESVLGQRTLEDGSASPAPEEPAQ